MDSQVNLKIHKVIDNEYFSTIDQWLVPYFKPTTTGYKLRNVGVVVSNDEIYAFLPHNVDKKKIGSAEVSKLIQVLTKFRKMSSAQSSEEAESVIQSNLFTIVEWLIEDFQQYGLYQKNEGRIALQLSGKIHWSKTIMHVQPLIQKEGPVFVEFMRTSHVDQEDVLSYIHGTMIQRIANKFGILFYGFKFMYHGRDRHLSDSEMLVILYQYRTRVNDERTKLLIGALIKLINIGKDKQVLGITTEEFHFVWEKMVNQYFQNKSRLYQYLAKDQWNIELGGHRITGSNLQVPDTLVEDKTSRKVHIVDAKYYDLTPVINCSGKGKRSVPLDWYSVVKQYFYDLSFDYKSSGLLQGNNWFIFPAWKMNYSVNMTSDSIYYVGSVSIKLPNYLEKKVVQVALMPVFSLIDDFLADRVGDISILGFK